MSFILDALKKSESDRQRRNGPALFEVKVTPPRSRLAPWAIAIAILLAVNLGIVLWMLLRRPVHDIPAPPTAGVSAAPTIAAAPTTVAAAAPAGSVPAPTLRANGVGVAAGSAAAPAPVPATTVAAGPPPAAQPPAGAATGADEGAHGTAEEGNPEDYAPAEAPAPAPPSHVRRGTAEGVPLYQNAAAAPGKDVPQLRLDLHVYAERPQDRFVMINMHKLREGDSLPDGVHVEAITPEGAVLSYNGSRFLLTRE